MRYVGWGWGVKNPAMRKGDWPVAFILTLRQERRSNTEAAGEVKGT